MYPGMPHIVLLGLNSFEEIIIPLQSTDLSPLILKLCMFEHFDIITSHMSLLGVFTGGMNGVIMCMCSVYLSMS